MLRTVNGQLSEYHCRKEEGFFKFDYHTIRMVEILPGFEYPIQKPEKQFFQETTCGRGSADDTRVNIMDSLSSNSAPEKISDYDKYFLVHRLH